MGKWAWMFHIHTWILYFSLQFLCINIYRERNLWFANIYIIYSYLYKYTNEDYLRHIIRKTLGIFYDIFLSYKRVRYMFNMIIICVYIVYYYNILEVGYFSVLLLLLYYSLFPSPAPCVPLRILAQCFWRCEISAGYFLDKIFWDRGFKVVLNNYKIPSREWKTIKTIKQTTCLHNYFYCTGPV